MRWRPCRGRRPESAAPKAPVPAPPAPLPENPYRRFYTQMPTFEELVRRTKNDAPDKKT